MHDEDVSTTNILVDDDVYLTIGKASNMNLAQLHAQIVSNVRSEGSVGISREKLDSSVGIWHIL